MKATIDYLLDPAVVRSLGGEAAAWKLLRAVVWRRMTQDGPFAWEMDEEAVEASLRAYEAEYAQASEQEQDHFYELCVEAAQHINELGLLAVSRVAAGGRITIARKSASGPTVVARTPQSALHWVGSTPAVRWEKHVFKVLTEDNTPRELVGAIVAATTTLSAMLTVDQIRYE